MVCCAAMNDTINPFKNVSTHRFLQDITLLVKYFFMKM